MDHDLESFDSLSFNYLNRIQNLFEEQFQDLQKAVNEISFPNVQPQNRKELRGEKLNELCAISRQQQETQKLLLKEHEECTKEIEKVNKKIDELNGNLEKFKEDLTISKGELKQMIKPLLKSIKKFSLQLDMKVEVKNLEDESRFVASVKFSSKENSKSVDFVIDRKNRCVLDFDARSVMSDDEANELKAEAMTDSGLNVKTLLIKLRDISC